MGRTGLHLVQQTGLRQVRWDRGRPRRRIGRLRLSPVRQIRLRHLARRPGRPPPRTAKLRIGRRLGHLDRTQNQAARRLQRDRKRLLDFRRVLDVRHQAHDRPDPGNHLARGRSGHLPGRRVSTSRGVTVRFVEHHVNRVTRRLHRKHAHERRDVGVFLIAVAFVLFRRAGLAARKIARPPRPSCRTRW